MRTSTTALFVAAAFAGAAGCGAGEDGAGQCAGKCDQLGDFDEVLEGRGDPIAGFLRDLGLGADGIASFDYGDLVAGVAEIQGCSADSWKTFVVSDPLVEDDVFPRLISTVCSDQPTVAAEFFIAASFKDPDEEDVDPRMLEMFAWDAAAGIYRFYATEPLADGRVRVEVDPQRCAECHLTPSNLPSDGMRMTPVMNELTQPWTHWNSEVPMFNGNGIPFRSHDFEVPLEVRDADDFSRYGRERVGSAQELEFIVREGHAKVALQRARDRRERNEDWEPAMNLLRPVFCEEQVNYTTEDFDSGKVQVTAVIPGGIREAYKAHRPDDWPWAWLNNEDARMRLPAVQAEAPLAMLPVRGNVDVDYENRLVAGRALTPHQVLRVRALDWKRPVFSEFRCDLWRSARQRLATEPPVLDELSPRDSTRVKVLFDYTMQIDGQPIYAGDETLIAVDLMDEARRDELAEALADGSVTSASCDDTGAGVCALDLDGFGDVLAAYVATFESGDADAIRAGLRAARDERLCHVQETFPNAPALPAISCRGPEALPGAE